MPTDPTAEEVTAFLGEKWIKLMLDTLPAEERLQGLTREEIEAYLTQLPQKDKTNGNTEKNGASAEK